MEFYEPAELEQVLRRAAVILGVDLRPDGGRGDRRPVAGHPAHREPAAAAGPRLRRGPRGRHGHPPGGPRRAGRLRRRRARPRPAGPCGAGGAGARLRRRPRRCVDARSGGGRGSRYRRGGLRAVSGASRDAGTHPGAGVATATAWAHLGCRRRPTFPAPACAVLRVGGWQTRPTDTRKTTEIMESLGGLLFPLLILLLFIPIFLSGRKQRRQMQDMQQLQSSLQIGDVVTTTSGLRGTVVDAQYEDTMDLEIADNVVTTWLRAAVKDKVLDAGAAEWPTRPPPDRTARAWTTGGQCPGRRPDQPCSVRDCPVCGAHGLRGRAGGRHAARRERHVAPVARLPAGISSTGTCTVGEDRHRYMTGRGNVASTPGRIRPWRHLAAFAGIVVVLYALVFFTGGPPRAQARHRPAGWDPGHADRAHRVGRRAAAGAAPAGPVDHRAAGERAWCERRRGRARRLEHHDHGARRGGRPGPVAGPDGAAALPRGRRRARGRGAPVADPAAPATDAPATDAPRRGPGIEPPESDAPAGAPLPRRAPPAPRSSPRTSCRLRSRNPAVRPAAESLGAAVRAPRAGSGGSTTATRRIRLAAAIDEARLTRQSTTRRCRPRPAGARLRGDDPLRS